MPAARLPSKDQPRRVHLGAHVEIRPLHRGMQEGARGADAAAFEDRALGVVDAELAFAVVVRVARDTHLDRARDEGLAQRVMVVDVGDGDPALAPAEDLVALPDSALQPLEVGQHVRIAPVAVAALRPAVIVGALAAIVDVPVDRRRAAERLATRREDAPSAGPLARLLGVEPVQLRHGEQLDEAGRDVDVGVPVARAGLEHADGNVGVCAQAVGEHAARRARADDHVIECVHGEPPTRQQRPQSEACNP